MKSIEPSKKGCMVNRLFVIVLAVIIAVAWIYDQYQHREYHNRYEDWHRASDCPCNDVKGDDGTIG